LRVPSVSTFPPAFSDDSYTDWDWETRTHRLTALAHIAKPEMRAAFIELAETWKRLTAETESDQALLRAIREMYLGEPYEDLPLALNLHAWAA
jgi:hypothetical protein